MMHSVSGGKERSHKLEQRESLRPIIDHCFVDRRAALA
jgi:hypothetical protein